MISIAMATYNGEKYIREQLDSILVQTIQDFELIVCDDCSVDSTRKILTEYGQKDERIKIFFNENNLGCFKNFEKAIGLCSGDYIALSDQDDIWYPEHLEILRNKIENFDIVSANASFIDEDGIPFSGSIRCAKSFVYSADQDSLMFASLYHCFFVGCTVMISHRLAQKALPFPLYIHAHDHYLGLVGMLQGEGGIVVPEKVLHYRQHSSSCSPRRRKNLHERIWYNLLRLFTDKDENITRHRAKIVCLLKKFCLDETDEYRMSRIRQAVRWFSSPCSPRKILFFIVNYRRMCLRSHLSLAFFRDFLRLVLRNGM